MTAGGKTRIPAKEDTAATSRGKRGKTGCLKVFAFTVIIILAVGIPVVRYYAYAKLKTLLLELANDKINGQVSIGRIYVNPITGTARILDAKITVAGEDSPSIELPSASLNIWPLLSNRIDAELEFPYLRLIRDEEGNINILSLLKPPGVKKERKYDVSVSFAGLNIEAIDRQGIPSAALAKLKERNGAAALLESRLAELGVKPPDNANAAPFEYSIKLERVQGRLEENAKGGILAISMKGLHATTPFSGDFWMNLDTQKTSANLKWGTESYAFFAPYVQQASCMIASLSPEVAISEISLAYARESKGETGALIAARIDSLGATLPGMQRLEGSGIEFQYDTGTGRLEIKQAELNSGEARLTLSGSVELKKGDIALASSISSLDLSALPKKLPISGTFSANVTAGGTITSPLLSGNAELADTTYQKHALGMIVADFEATKDKVSLSEFTVAGGELALSGSGYITSKKEVEIDYVLAPASAAKLAKLANTSSPVQGMIASRGHLSLGPGGAPKLSGTAASPRLEAGDQTLDGVYADFNLDGDKLSVRSFRFAYQANDKVTIETAGQLSASNLKSGNMILDVRAESTLSGVSRIEVERELPPGVEIVVLPGLDSEGNIVDPNAPKKGVVITSTDPTRIGKEVWWPRLKENEKEDSGGEAPSNNVNGGSAPSAPGVGWITEYELANARQALLRNGIHATLVTVDATRYPAVSFDGKIAVAKRGRTISPSDISVTGSATVTGILLKPVKFEITSGAPSENGWFYATAQGKYKNRGFTARMGYKPCKGCDHEYNAYILYGNSDFAIKGKLNVDDLTVAADVESQAIQLEDLLDIEGAYGSATLTAKVSGKLTDPSATGIVKVDSAEYSVPSSSRPAVAFENGEFPFAASKNRLSIENGSFDFGKSRLGLSGTVAGGEMNVKLSSDAFSLEELAHVIAPKMTVAGTGSLLAQVTGTTHDPTLNLSFTQEYGEVNGIAFNGATLEAMGKLKGIKVSKLSIASDGGLIEADGELAFTKGNPMTADLKLSSFEAGVVTPLFLGKTDANLTGTVDGKIKLSGSLAAPEGSVNATLTDGRILDQNIDSAELIASLHNDEIAIDSFQLFAGDSTVVVSGLLKTKLADKGLLIDIPNSKLSIDAPNLDLKLVNPFIGMSAKEGFRGTIAIMTTVKSGDRGPYMDGSVNNYGEFGLGNVFFSGMSGVFQVYTNGFEFHEFVLKTKDSALLLDGTIPIVVSKATEEAIRTGKITSSSSGGAPVTASSTEAPRFNVTLKADKFKLDYIASLFPKLGMKADGTVTADLILTGAPKSPILNGTINLDVKDFDFRDIASAGSITGNVKIAYDPDMVWETFTLGTFVIAEAMAGKQANPAKGGKPAKETAATGGAEVKEHTVEVGGGGAFRLPSKDPDTGATRPSELYTLDVSALLERFEQFTVPEMYKGPLEGEITLSKDVGDVNIHVGGSVTLGTGGTLTIRMPDSKNPPMTMPITFGTRAPVETAETAAAAAPQSKMQIASVPLTPFRVYVYQGVNVRIPSIVDLRAEIQGARDESGKTTPLKISGAWPDIEISGRLESYKGSLIVLRHTFRVVDPPLLIRFDKKDGVVPYIKGRAAVVIPGAASGGSADIAGGFDNTLTVYVNLDNLASDLDSPRLTSDPPLSEDEIRRRMLGVLPPAGSVQGLSPELRDELYNLVGARVSRLLEEKLNVEQFSLRIGQRQELYVDVEKQVSPRLSILYSATFFSNDRETEKEQFGVKYLFLKKRFVQGYIEGLYDNSGSGFYGNEINIVLKHKF